MEESCYSPANCAKGGVLDTKPSLNLNTHHYTPLCSFLLFRFHSMHVLVIWDYTPTAFLISFELNIISYSVQDNSLPSSKFIFLFCHTSRESYKTDILSIEGNNFGLHSQIRQHKTSSPRTYQWQRNPRYPATPCLSQRSPGHQAVYLCMEADPGNPANLKWIRHFLLVEPRRHPGQRRRRAAWWDPSRGQRRQVAEEWRQGCWLSQLEAAVEFPPETQESTGASLLEGW